MKLKLSGLSIAALTTALSFPVTAAVDVVSPTTSTDASSSEANDQLIKMAMKKCSKKNMTCKSVTERIVRTVTETVVQTVSRSNLWMRGFMLSINQFL